MLKLKYIYIIIIYFQFKNTYKKYFALQFSTHGIYLGCFYKKINIKKI